MPWDPMKDYAFMMRNTELFMSLWRSIGPSCAKVHGFAVAGGSDIALCSDMIVMADNAEIGYMPVRVWGCPTTAMWVYRLGAGTGQAHAVHRRPDRRPEAERIGLVHKSVPEAELDAEVERLAERMATVPVNQLMMQKLVVNQAIEAMGLKQTQMFATIFDGITRHSPEGLNFKHRAEEMGWKHAVRERDLGTFDWTRTGRSIPAASETEHAEEDRPQTEAADGCRCGQRLAEAGLSAAQRRFRGLHGHRCFPGGCTVRLNATDRHLRPGNTVSGPSLFTLADIGGYVCVLTHAGPEALSVTTNLNINFMRKAEAGRSTAIAGFSSSAGA
jgi:hypothetical protein